MQGHWLRTTPATAGLVLLARSRDTGELLGRLADRVVRLDAEPSEFAEAARAVLGDAQAPDGGRG